MTTSRQFSIEAACLLGLNALSIMGAVALLCLELGTAHGATEPLRGSLSLDGTREIATTPVRAANSSASAVDFRYSPPEWQTAICLPDDPQKSLVDRSGELLYHYNQGGREFGTRIGVQVVGDSVWQRQELYSPRVPIVRTQRAADGWR